MNLCKVLQAQAGSMKGTWSSARVGGKNVKLPGTKKCSADDEELKTLVALAVAKTTKTTKKKSKRTNMNRKLTTSQKNSTSSNLSLTVTMTEYKAVRSGSVKPNCAGNALSPLNSLSLLMK